jgi:hypothetical protein
MPTSNNRLLASLSSDDFDLLEPHLESVRLGLRKNLERPNRRIDAVYFPEWDSHPLLRFNPMATRSKWGLLAGRA